MEKHWRPLSFLLFLLLWPAFDAASQFYTAGQGPASIRWKQIETENFRVIYPSDYEEQAAYVADVLEFSYRHASASLGHRPVKVPVILHNQTVISNGFVSWAPRRIEMFSNPPQNNDTHDWLDRLAVHEFRHVVQIDKLNQGLTRVLSTLLGEQGTGIVLGLYFPLWLLEGDAVAVETALTNSGRGRIPAFEQGLRAQIMKKGPYSFDKAVFGSFKDHVPNHYELGYQLVASARTSYGAGIWDKVVDNIARRPHSITPLSSGLRKHAGVNKVEHYEQTFEMLDSAWRTQEQQYAYTPYELVNPSNKSFTSYTQLSFADDTTLIALKTGLDEIPQLVALDLKGNEKRLFYPGFYNSLAFSAGAGKVVWSEVRPDPRWQHRNWSEIHAFDINTGKRERITRNTRFFAPATSPNGQYIAVAEVSPRNEYALVIIDAKTGEEKYRLPTPENKFIMTPSWNKDNRTLVILLQDSEGKSITLADILSGEFETVFHSGHVDMSTPVFKNVNEILFSGAFSGINKIYQLDLRSGKVEQVVVSRFGAAYPASSPNGEKLFWSDYSADGYKVAMRRDVPGNGLSLEKVENHSVKFYETLARQEEAVVSRENIPRRDHEPRKYSRLVNLINVHSWGPFALDVDNMEGNPGASLFSQNALSTSFTSIGYEYDLNDELGKFFLNYSYYGWYPVVDITAETGKRRSYYRTQQDGELIPFLWRENSLKAGLSLPLSFRRYQYFYGINPSMRTGLIGVRSTDDTPDFFQKNDMHTMEYRLVVYRQRRAVAKDLRPRWAQIADINFRHTPFGGGDMGSVFSARITGFFPGLFRHHSIRLSAAFQEHVAGTPEEQTINYRFPNLISYPRGITGRYDDQLLTFSADYALPLFYPDWSLPPILYLRRVSANFFADHAVAEFMVIPEEGDPFNNRERLNTMGVDLTGNMHLFRFFNPLDLGLRTIYRAEDEQIVFQLLFGISF